MVKKQIFQIESKGFYQWCTILRFTKFVDFAHRPEFSTSSKHNFSETESVCVFRITGLRLAVSKKPITVGVSLPSPEDGNSSSFRNVF
jgi:hypothetical protein